MAEQRFTIDPAQFTDSQWEELYNASTITPRTMEAKRNARAFKRPRKYIELAIENLHVRSIEVRQIHGDEEWADDLNGAAETLREIVGPRKRSKAQATNRLHDLLRQDIFTDAPEYRDRVEEVSELLPIVFGKFGRAKA